MQTLVHIFRNRLCTRRSQRFLGCKELKTKQTELPGNGPFKQLMFSYVAWHWGGGSLSLTSNANIAQNIAVFKACYGLTIPKTWLNTIKTSMTHHPNLPPYLRFHNQTCRRSLTLLINNYFAVLFHLKS